MKQWVQVDRASGWAAKVRFALKTLKAALIDG
jgi:hypothetical protein